MNIDCTAVMYHYVRDTEKTPFKNIKALSIQNFVEQLEWLNANYFFFDENTLNQHVSTKTSADKPSTILTFDDGFIDNYDTVFPILKERNLSGIFFICDSIIQEQPLLLNVHKIHFLLAHMGADAFGREVMKAIGDSIDIETLDDQEREGLYRYDTEGNKTIKKILNYVLPYDVADEILSSLFKKTLGDETSFARKLYVSAEMVKEMSDKGMTFGAHTKNHRVLSRLNAAQQREELSPGFNRIQELTGQKRIPFGYPYGGLHTYTSETISILEKIGYSIAFNTNRRPIDFTKDQRFELPRLDTKDLPPFTKGIPEIRCSIF